MLREFIVSQRTEILAQARLRVAARAAPIATESELTDGLPMFLDQLVEALQRAALHKVADHAEIQKSSTVHGDDLFRGGLTVAQVVHDYGHICQVITGLAVTQNAAIAADEFQTLNLCLDDAIAGAVTEHGRRRERAILDQGTQTLGMLAHEMRNALNSALLSFDSIKKGHVAPGGSTGQIVDRSLMRLQTLIARALADVRLEAGKVNVEPVLVADILDEVEAGAAPVAHGRGVRLAVDKGSRAVSVVADRAILAAAVANLVQNALKFTRPGTTVKLGTRTTKCRVFFDVEDECGGLPSGASERLLLPFAQRGSDRTGLGLGLAICVKSMKAMAGELHITDRPRQGCIFTLELPKQVENELGHDPSPAREEAMHVYGRGEH